MAVKGKKPTTTAPPDNPAAKIPAGQSARHSEAQSILNRVLLFLSVAAWFFVVKTALALEIDSLPAVVLFFAGIILALFPNIREIHKTAWFRQLWTTVALFALLLVGAVLLTVQMVKAPPRTGAAYVSLISASYMHGGYDPHLIDFRSAAEVGIPVSAKMSMAVYGLVVKAPQSAAGLEAQARIFAGERLMAESKRAFLTNGTNTLPDPEPKSWDIPEGTGKLNIQIVLLKNGVVTGSFDNEVKIASQWTEGWLNTPPTASIVAIGYAIDDGPTRWVDLRSAETSGIYAPPGSRLAVREVWYQSRFGSEKHTLHLESYLTVDGYNKDTDVSSAAAPMNRQAHAISELKAFQWQVAEEYNYLMMTLARDDSAILDRYRIPLNETNPPINSWGEAFPVIETFGFEGEAVTKPWASIPNGKYGLQISAERAHSGKQSLAMIFDSGGMQTGDFGGVVLTQSVYSKFREKTVAAAEGWMLVPETDQSEGKTFTALMTGVSYDKDGNYLQASSKRLTVEPGKWTRIAWEGAYTTVHYDMNNEPMTRFEAKNRLLHEIYLDVWCDQSYSGLVFFDDITFFAEEP